MSLRLAALLLTVAASAPAPAQTVHKCTVDGKVTYAEQPCQGGQASVIAVPDAPAQDKAAPADLTRLKKQADALELARHKKEDADERADAAASRTLAKRHQTCEKLKLEKKWADEDMRRAQPQHEERARIKAQRAGEKLKLSCGA
ncbi:DUF4124 domain-containing protein [Pseudoduganella sp. LjRoot289]|uniref:DUF4124 domain-containing protein n=1 Tax=Pseudoduganella sp. LjRoot289 TaxID=3342314 RepID=UPI003ECEBAFB